MNNINASAQGLFNKVPEVTIAFWIIKMMSTTVGETAADYLIFGLTVTSIIMGGILVAILVMQLHSNKYVPWKYWLAVVLVSIFGTLVTDNLTDQVGVPLEVSTIVLQLFFLLHFGSGTPRKRHYQYSLSIHLSGSCFTGVLYW